jgi:signal transduction histidine kinase/ligand-binding sensor domain-containing protein
MALSQIIGTERLFGQFQQFVWQDQHGLPQNGISEIVQTPDGYLWMAIAEGVVRFDGVRFTAFDTGNTPEIKSNNVQSLLVDRSGTLWLGTHGGGVIRYKNGLFTNFSTSDGLSSMFIKSLFEDRAGNIWVGTDGSGLNLFQNGKFSVLTTDNGLPDNYINSLGENGAGILLVGTRKGLARYKDGEFTVFTRRDGLADDYISKIFLDRDGDVWLGSPSGVSRWHERSFTVFGAREGLNHEIKSIAQDQAGTLWFGTIGGGLHRLKDERIEAATTQEGLINDEIQAIFADQLGNLWLGTNGGGLAQLKGGRFKVYTNTEGLPGNIVSAVFEDSTGAIWIGTDEGLARFKDGKITKITAPDGNRLAGTNGITEDRNGNILINSGAGDKALKYREGSSTVEIVSGEVFENRSSVMLADKSGNQWFGTSTDGLHRIDGSGNETAFRKQDGLPDNYVNVLYEDRAGSIWIGTRSGLSRFQNGVFTNFDKQNGFGNSHVLSFHEDRAGDLWIGTHGDGLFRFRDGKFISFTSKNGLYDNLAFSIVEDGDRNLWMSGNKGIYRVSINELGEFAEGRRASVHSYSYGSADGMLSRECNGANPGGIRDKTGLLWFPTIKGVVVVDPKIKDEKQPFVNIEQVLVDNKVSPFNQKIKIQPDEDNLEIQFTALSWSRPSQIKFKYQLVGLDDEWIEAGTRRSAYYTHLPPGDYTFRVIADNGDGIWNNEGQSLSFVILPPFYRTWWFFILCVAAALLLIGFIYHVRLSQLQKISVAKTMFTQQLIESQEQERKRIAVELHDSIGQSLIVIRNRALLGLNTPDKQDRLIAQLEEISESAADSITEVRRIAHNLHPYQLEHLGLTTAIETMIESAEAASPIEFEKEIDDLDGLLTKEAEINLYRIVQESLNNILKHSGATKVKVSILKSDDLLTVTIKDNGRGFNTEHLFKPKGGLGLTGIRERAIMLGAKHEIFSIPNQGATLSLQINLPQTR